MQCFKLVNGGFVDRVIVFDSLPDRFIKNVRTREAAGFPRAWVRWLAAMGSVRTVFKTDTTVDAARTWRFKHTAIGEEPCFFVLDYKDLNADKQSWHEICDYLRQNVGPEVRLKEKIDDMALPLAPNSTSELSVEPEDVYNPENGTGSAYIPLPKEVVKEVPDSQIVQQGEQILVTEVAPKRRGRHKKVAVEA